MKRLMTMTVLGAALLAVEAFGGIRALDHSSYYGGDPNVGPLRRHNEKMNVVTNGGAKVVFVGDSITHFWETAGKVQLKRYFSKGDYRMLNLGISGERTEHILWRLNEGGELDGYEAKAVVLSIGENNVVQRKDAAADVDAAVREILALIAAKQPQAKVVLMPIFPFGANDKDAKRIRNEEVNKLIRPLADGKRVVWFDINAKFLDEKGDNVKWMPDHCHPNAAGYKEIWLPALLPYLKETCGK